MGLNCNFMEDTRNHRRLSLSTCIFYCIGVFSSLMRPLTPAKAIMPPTFKQGPLVSNKNSLVPSPWVSGPVVCHILYDPGHPQPQVALYSVGPPGSKKHSLRTWSTLGYDGKPGTTSLYAHCETLGVTLFMNLTSKRRKLIPLFLKLYHTRRVSS